MLVKGDCIALPEWEGFWFADLTTKKIFVLTKEGKILDTPSDQYKQRNDWMVVIPSKKQQVILDNFFALKTTPFTGLPTGDTDAISKERELTFGELAVGITFNPSAMSDVDKVKRGFAQIIDLCNDISTFTYLGNTFKGMAIRACIEAQMAVVKLITFKEK